MTGARATPRHITITGASSGLGAALARHYAGPGAMLSLSGRDCDRLDAVAEACRTAGATVDARIVDVTDSQAMVDWLIARDEAQPMDLVFANAGVGGTAVLAEPHGEEIEAVRRILEVNMLGVVHTMAPLAPRMRTRGRGHFVVMSSMASLIALPQSPAYCASKAAVTSYGEAMRRLLAPAGVKVTVVHPGFIDTPMSASLPYDRPLLWTAERAATHIARGVARGRAEIAFPRRFRLAVSATRLLPTRLVDAVLARGTGPAR